MAERTEDLEAAAAGLVLSPRDPSEEADVQREMASLHRRDFWWAVAFVVGLLATLPFVGVVAVWVVMPDGIQVIASAAVGVLLLYNVTSMQELVRNYRRDFDYIYRRDVAHLRAARRAWPELDTAAGSAPEVPETAV